MNVCGLAWAPGSSPTTPQRAAGRARDTFIGMWTTSRVSGSTDCRKCLKRSAGTRAHRPTPTWGPLAAEASSTVLNSQLLAAAPHQLAREELRTRMPARVRARPAWRRRPSAFALPAAGGQRGVCLPSWHPLAKSRPCAYHPLSAPASAVIPERNLSLSWSEHCWSVGGRRSSRGPARDQFGHRGWANCFSCTEPRPGRYLTQR